MSTWPRNSLPGPRGPIAPPDPRRSRGSCPKASAKNGNSRPPKPAPRMAEQPEGRAGPRDPRSPVPGAWGQPQNAPEVAHKARPRRRRRRGSAPEAPREPPHGLPCASAKGRGGEPRSHEALPRGRAHDDSAEKAGVTVEHRRSGVAGKLRGLTPVVRQTSSRVDDLAQLAGPLPVAHRDRVRPAGSACAPSAGAGTRASTGSSTRNGWGWRWSTSRQSAGRTPWAAPRSKGFWGAARTKRQEGRLHHHLLRLLEGGRRVRE